MKHSNRSENLLRFSVAFLVLLLAVLPSHARVRRSQTWAASQFASAQRLQEALEARPAQELTRADYERVINSYRRVYFAAPASSKADPSVVAVAQLLEEMGRRFDDDNILRAAIQQYEFLRRQYPGSKSRFNALFRIAEIYKDDLHDKARADEVFEEFLRRYPRNPFAGEARKALAEPVQKASLKSAPATKATKKKPEEDSATDQLDEKSANQDTGAASEKNTGKLARVTAIRYWSTPGCTRVAIDLAQEVKFDSQRLEHPDRVFFDLLGSKLDARLAGKTFDVDDGVVKKIRTSQFDHRRTRVVLEVEDQSDFQASLLSNPPRLMIEIRHKAAGKAPESGTAKASEATEPREVKAPASAQTAPPSKERANADEVAPSNANPIVTVVNSNGVKKTIVDAGDEDGPAAKKTEAKLEPVEVKPASVLPSATAGTEQVKSRSGKRKGKTSSADVDVREAQPTASGDRSLIRALGLKIGKIVIDPGHGGHDTGTIGPNGLEEKELVLDVSRRLGKLLESRLGAQVAYTRSDDTFIPLETRTAIANQASADLFVSIHANSSHDPDARGVETYYLNFTSSPDALEVAARENAVSDKSIHELQDLVKKIALKEKIEESREFATDVERSLHGGLAVKNPGLRDRGVKKAPFIVLIGANMPSILAEISFVSNPNDARRLQTPEYRQRIAESLYRGIAKYVSGLSGVKVASKIDKGEGQ